MKKQTRKAPEYEDWRLEASELRCSGLFLWGQHSKAACGGPNQFRYFLHHPIPTIHRIVKGHAILELSEIPFISDLKGTSRQPKKRSFTAGCVSPPNEAARSWHCSIVSWGQKQKDSAEEQAIRIAWGSKCGKPQSTKIEGSKQASWGVDQMARGAGFISLRPTL